MGNNKILFDNKKFNKRNDYIPDPQNKYNHSLKKFLDKHPDGATLQEIAEALGTVYTNVKHILYWASKKMQKKINKMDKIESELYGKRKDK